MQTKEPTRQSNFELLRIVCMFAILCLHVLHHGCSKLALSSGADILSQAVHDALGFHVNAFLLISGYFGIRMRAKGFFRFFIPCAFYSALIWLVFALYYGEPLTVTGLLKRFHFFYRESPWWFVENYFFLFLTAPLINAALARSRQEVLLFLGLLAFLNIVCGGVLHSGFNSNGFNYNHFVFMYFTGGCIRRFDFSLSRNRCLLGYAVVTALIFLESTFVHAIRDYINPLVVAQAVLVFLLFKTVRVQSALVNSVAASVFSVYLMHDEDVYARGALSSLVRRMGGVNWPFSTGYDFVFIVAMIGFSVAAFFALIIADKILSRLFIDRLTGLADYSYRKITDNIKKWVRL